MKKGIFALLCLFSIGLQAEHFQSSLSVKPAGDEDAYFVNVRVERVSDENPSPELIASPETLCIVGHDFEFEMGEDLLIKGAISEEKAVYSSVLLKEEGKTLVSLSQSIQLD